MYPYRNRTRWIMASRYGHLVHALDKRRRFMQDSLLDSRIKSMRWWNRVRFVVSLILSIGLIATGAAALARLLPGSASTIAAVQTIFALSGAAAGLMTLAYIFLTRLLSQLEVDIFTIITLEHGKS